MLDFKQNPAKMQDGFRVISPSMHARNPRVFRRSMVAARLSKMDRLPSFPFRAGPQLFSGANCQFQGKYIVSLWDGQILGPMLDFPGCIHYTISTVS